MYIELMSVKMNNVVKSYILSDAIFWTVNVFMLSFFPIYTGTLYRDRVAMVTLIISVYALTRGITQIPFSKLMDRMKGYNDEKIFMILGIFLSSFSILMLLFDTSLGFLVIRQIVAGLGNAMFLVGGKKLINKHIDKSSVGYEIAINESAVLLSTSVLLIIVGGVTSLVSFQAAFLVASILNLVAFFPIILTSREEVIMDLQNRGIIDPVQAKVSIKEEEEIEEDTTSNEGELVNGNKQSESIGN